MTDQTQRLEIATVKAEIGSNILSRFSNDAIGGGGIPTDSGDIKNLKLIIKEIEDKASVSTSIYTTVADGLTATEEGGMFLVQSSEDDEIYVVWRKVDGAAVDTGKRALSSQAAESAVAAAQASADASAAFAVAAQSAAETAAADFQDIFDADQLAREQEFNEFMDSLGFESVYLVYGPGVVVERQSQLTQREGELYRVLNAADIPLTLTGTWATDALKLEAVGDAALRQVLLSPDGAKNVFTQAPGANTAVRSLYSKTQREIELSDYIAGGADDTVQFQNMLADIPSKTTSRLISIPGLTASYSGTTPRVIVRAGDYSISQTLNPPAYLRLEGEMAFITQTNPELDIISALAYQWEMEGFVLIGGRNQIDAYNANLNSTMIDLKYVEHFLSSGFAINTRATGGVWTHLSAEFNIYKSRIMSCKQAINNACDSMTVKNSWIQPSKSNMSPSTAVMVNKGATAGDPDCFTRLKIQDTFLIPDLGVQGVDRVDSVRWVDNYGSFLADHARFGGENGGIPIVWQHGAPNTASPWNTTEVILRNSTLFCGPDTRTDSCVLGIQGQVPNTFIIEGDPGPVGTPLIANLSSTDLAAYFAAFEAASGKKAYEYFKVKIDTDTHNLNAYTPLRPIIPDGMYPYLVKGRSTRIRKQTQSLANAFAVNLVSFATIEQDNLGAFTIANPTRLVMPNGCFKMTISASVWLQTDGAAKTVSIDVVDSGGTIWDGDTGQRGINPDTDRIRVSFEVSGAPGTYWSLRIRHNAAAALNLVDCRVKLTPSDHSV